MSEASLARRISVTGILSAFVEKRKQMPEGPENHIFEKIGGEWKYIVKEGSVSVGSSQARMLDNLQTLANQIRTISEEG